MTLVRSTMRMPARGPVLRMSLFEVIHRSNQALCADCKAAQSDCAAKPVRPKAMFRASGFRLELEPVTDLVDGEELTGPQAFRRDFFCVALNRAGAHIRFAGRIIDADAVGLAGIALRGVRDRNRSIRNGHSGGERHNVVFDTVQPPALAKKYSFTRKAPRSIAKPPGSSRLFQRIAENGVDATWNQHVVLTAPDHSYRWSRRKCDGKDARIGVQRIHTESLLVRDDVLLDPAGETEMRDREVRAAIEISGHLRFQLPSRRHEVASRGGACGTASDK